MIIGAISNNKYSALLHRNESAIMNKGVTKANMMKYERTSKIVSLGKKLLNVTTFHINSRCITVTTEVTDHARLLRCFVEKLNNLCNTL